MKPRVEDAIAHILPALQTVFDTHLRAAIVKGEPTPARLIVITGDPLRVWRSGLDKVIPLLNPVGSPAIQTFFSEVRSWPQRRGEPDYHRVLLHQGLRAMGDLAAWWDATRDASRP